jgi:hypothetical protein
MENKTVNWVWVVILLVLIGIVGIQESFAEEEIKVDGGKLLSFENTNEYSSMIFEINPYIANIKSVTIEIPKNIWYLVDSECNLVQPFILVDGEETTFSEHFEKNKQILTIDVIGGSKEIEIGDWGPASPHTTNFMYGQFCFMQEQGIFLSPNKQTDLGFMFYNVQCKEGLELIFKQDNSPACVKPETASKLIERGWAKS